MKAPSTFWIISPAVIENWNKLLKSCSIFKKYPLPVQNIPSPKTIEQVIQTVEKPVAASVSIPKAQPKTVEVEIPNLKDPGMKLQAITWSKAPQKRIAVINNRILREGETVSGYLIKTINQDDILLSLDGEKWKLLFR